jgi:DNA polymerase type B, organellar and viral
LFTFFKEDSNNLIVYAHNFSGFDGIFLLEHLLDYGKIEPLLFNGKLISIKLKININEYKDKTIIFKDSMLLLPHGLRDLCKAFNIGESKGIFPMNLNDINYSSIFPSFKYFNNLTLQEYLLLLNNNKNKMWNFKDESTKYCKLDCKCLHEIITKFNELIFNEFSINVHKLLTLPALAMRIFKSKFMPKNMIFQLHGIVERNIRQSYTGGAVDSYIPHNKIGNFIESNEYETIYQYDANALYPSVMTNNLMPIGKPIAFLGDIRRMEPDSFGFFYCKITSPEYLEHPILQRRIKTSEGIRTIAGLGSWEGWICSTEMDNAVNLGYQFEILKGYQFETGDIFTKYLTRLYNLRLNNNY